MRKRNVLLIALLIVVPGGFLAIPGIWAWLQWEEFTGKVSGTRVPGDDTVSPTTNPFSHLYLRLFGWRMTAVLEVPPDAAARGYRVGYVPFAGSARVHAAIRTGARFRMRVGREDPVFFAVAKDGTEVPLTLVARTAKEDLAYAALPLY